MKKIFSIITITTLVGSLLFSTSCKKKDNELPTPMSQTKPTISNANFNGNLVVVDGVSITRVDFYHNGINVYTDSSSPFEFNIPGTYDNFEVKAFNSEGGMTTKRVDPFTIGSTTPINTAPTFTSKDFGQLPSYVVDITSKVSDKDGDPITITSATTTTNGVTILISNDKKSFNVITSNITTGSIIVTVKITDDKGNSTTSYITLSLTQTAMANSIMSGYYKLFTTSLPSGLRINSNGTVSTGGLQTDDNNVGFWGANCTSGNWSINTSGQVVITGCNTTNIYDITTNTSGDLVLGGKWGGQ